MWVEVNKNEQRYKENIRTYLQSFFMNNNSASTTKINIFFIDT